MFWNILSWSLMGDVPADGLLVLKALASAAAPCTATPGSNPCTLEALEKVLSSKGIF